MPFEKVKDQTLDAKLDLKNLSRISIVRAKKAYEIEVYIEPIEFYSKNTS
jgi:hypothetical protein